MEERELLKIMLFFFMVPGLAFLFYFIGSYNEKYRYIKKLNTIQIREKSKLIRISSVVLYKKKQGIHMNGLFILATDRYYGKSRQISITVPLTTQDIKKTIDAIKEGLPLFVNWGKNPLVTFSVNSAYNVSISSISKSYIGDILHEIGLSFPGGYSGIRAKADSSLCERLLRIFEELLDTQVISAYEM